MQIQPINNNNNPGFGYLNIEPSRRLVKYLGQYEKTQGTDIKTMISLLTSKLACTKYLHGNLSYGKNNTRNKIPKLQVIMHKNLELPYNGKYEITNKDGSTTVCRILSSHNFDWCSFGIIENEKSIPEKSLFLQNGHFKDNDRVFDIVKYSNFDNDTNCKNEYFPIPNGELFVNQIINADNILQAFEEDRAIKLDEKCIEPYPYSPYIQSGYNEFMRTYNRVYPEYASSHFI